MQKVLRYYSMLEPSGYGLSALAYIDALLAQGIRVYWTPVVPGEQGYVPWVWMDNAEQQLAVMLAEYLMDEERTAALLGCLVPPESYQHVVLHTVPEYWPALLEPDCVHIGYTVWETSRLPGHFPALINQMNKVLVPAQFNLSVFRQSGVSIPLECVPHILDASISAAAMQKKTASKNLCNKKNSYIFYSINAWNSRKAMWTLLHAYLKAFTGDDPVELCLKTSQRGPAHELDTDTHRTDILVQNIIEQYPNPARVRLIREKLDAIQVVALHQAGDCYVSATHSEGWGLGAFEAAGYGNPVIMTGWGGQLDFLPAELAWLVDYRLVTVKNKRGEGSYHNDQQWAEIDEQHMIKLMREVFTHREQAQKRADLLAEHLQQLYNPVVVGKMMRQAIFM